MYKRQGYNTVDDEELPSVKHLLADVCNAINERVRWAFNFELEFLVANGDELPDVVPDDFVGARVRKDNSSGESFIEDILDDIITKLKARFTAIPVTNRVFVGFYTDDSFDTTWTWDNICDDVGLLTSEEMENVLNWRQRDYWLTLRGIIERMRYIKISAGCYPYNVAGRVIHSAGDGPPPQTMRNVHEPYENWESQYFDGSANWLGYETTNATEPPPREIPSYGYTDSPPFDPYATHGYNEFISCDEIGFVWDSDYLHEGGIPNEFGALRTFPIPKSAATNLVTVSAANPCDLLWYNNQLWNPARPETEDDSPSQSIAYDIDFGGQTINISNGNSVKDLTFGPDGDETVTWERPESMPTSYPDFPYIPDAFYDPSNPFFEVGGSCEITGGWVYQPTFIYVGFDVNSVTDYPA